MNDQVKQYITEYTRRLDALRAELVAKFNIEFYPQLLTLMDGQFESVTWEQYTPYFNDGETCHFGLHIYDAFVLISGDDATDSYELKGHAKECANAIETFLYGIEEILEMVYGDHKRIIVTKDGIEVEDCADHD